jgi:hypothetical protein
MNNNSYTTSIDFKKNIAIIGLIGTMGICLQPLGNFKDMTVPFDIPSEESSSIGDSTRLNPILYDEKWVENNKIDMDLDSVDGFDDNDGTTNVSLSILGNYFIINELANYYIITNPAKDYLLTNLFLWPLLVELKDEIKKYFDDELYIETIIDPEDNDESLFLGINTNLDFDLAMERFDMFIKKWWLNNMGRAENKLDIDVMFI